MTSLEDRLSALLHDAAPHPAGVSYDAVVRRGRRRRRAVVAGSTTAVTAALAGLVVGVAGVRGGGPERVATAPSPTAGAAPRSVAFEGISFALPDGWEVTQQPCGYPADRTVVVKRDDLAARCPAAPVPAAPATAVTLSSLYGRPFARSWTGQRTTWQGQPAWLAEQTTGRTTTLVLTLPWVNAEVSAQSADAATARDLLDRVTVQKGDGLEVPADATSVFVQSLAGHDGDGQQRSATVTDATDVRRLLADLRSLTPVTAPAQACDGAWTPRTALLTVHGDGPDRTYAARFDACGQVVAGTGSAARTSEQLLGDVRRLVGNAGL